MMIDDTAKGVNMDDDHFHELSANEILEILDGLTEEQRNMVWETATEYKDNPRFPNNMARFSAALHELGLP